MDIFMYVMLGALALSIAGVGIWFYAKRNDGGE